MSVPPDYVTYRGCRCGRVVVAPDNKPGARPGIWCPSAEAGIHDYMMPYPF